MKEKKGVFRLPGSRWVRITLVIVIFGVAVWLVLAWVPWHGLWEWITVSKIDTESSSETGSTTMRNVGLVIAGVVTVGLLIWRGYAANKQASATQRQAEIAQQQEERAQQQVNIAQRQAETAQQGLRNERYQKGAEMLGSNVLSVRMGGIYALQRLDKEHPEEYHVQIIRLLCAFVRRPTPDKEYETELQANIESKLQADIKPKLNADVEGPVAREDVQDAIQAIGARSEKEIALERSQGLWQLDLSHARLSHTNLRDTSLTRRTNLTGANLYNADMSHANLISVDLTNAWLRGAYLFKAMLFDAILFKSDLTHARVSGTIFGGVEGLTQNQLDQARRLDPGEAPPHLLGALDAVSGEQLEWRGGS